MIFGRKKSWTLVLLGWDSDRQLEMEHDPYRRFKMYVRPAGLRPDYRLVACFLWGSDRDYDSDGDCQYPSDRQWKELTLIDRANDEDRVDVVPVSENPLTLEVFSPSSALACRCAFFLALYSDGDVSTAPSGEYVRPDQVLKELGDFDLEAATVRIQNSPYFR